jgi:RNA polymerase sigma-70 factor (ECF subfamily)
MRSNRGRVSPSRRLESTFHQLLVPVVDAALRRVLMPQDQEYEDLLQGALETVLAALRKDGFRGDSSLSTWASRIARNVAIDALRARSRERRVFAHEADTEDVAAQSQHSGPSPEKFADIRQQLTRYHDALWTLCPNKAEVVYLYEVQGYGLEEIAAKLGLSIAATQSRLVRGRKEIGDIVASLERRSANLRVERIHRPSGVPWRGSPSRL